MRNEIAKNKYTYIKKDKDIRRKVKRMVKCDINQKKQ
jgi:hypothetical protein